MHIKKLDFQNNITQVNVSAVGKSMLPATNTSQLGLAAATQYPTASIQHSRDHGGYGDMEPLSKFPVPVSNSSTQQRNAKMGWSNSFTGSGLVDRSYYNQKLSHQQYQLQQIGRHPNEPASATYIPNPIVASPPTNTDMPSIQGACPSCALHGTSRYGQAPVVLKNVPTAHQSNSGLAKTYKLMKSAERGELNTVNLVTSQKKPGAHDKTGPHGLSPKLQCTCPSNSNRQTHQSVNQASRRSNEFSTIQSKQFGGVAASQPHGSVPKSLAYQSGESRAVAKAPGGVGNKSQMNNLNPLMNDLLAYL